MKYISFSEPSPGNESASKLLPIQNDQTHFLTIGNHGLFVGINPRQKTMEFWNEIRQRAFELSENLVAGDVELRNEL